MYLFFACKASLKRIFSTSRCCVTCRRWRINARRAFPLYSGAIHRVQSSCSGSHYGSRFIGNCTHTNILILNNVGKSNHVYARLRAWCCLLHGRCNVLIAIDRVWHCSMDRRHTQNMCRLFACITSATRMLITSKCCAMCRRRQINAKRACPCYSSCNKHGAVFVSWITLLTLLYCLSFTHVNIRVLQNVSRSINAYARLRAWCCLLCGRGSELAAFDGVLNCIMDCKHKQN